MINYKIIDPDYYPSYNNMIKNNFNPYIFHSSEWAKTLKHSFNYNLNYFIFFENTNPIAVIPLCEIRSIITGNRGVSLPYTDHCMMLNSVPDTLGNYLYHVINYAKANSWDYLEFRTVQNLPSFQPNNIFFTHEIDISKPADILWNSLEKNNKRNIIRANKNGLSIRIQTDMTSLKDFYHLHLSTRKRHNLPPQPFRYFKSIYENIISKGLGNIISCYLRSKLLASSIYFSFNNNAVFAFGASDPKYHHLRPNNFIMWESILWLKTQNNYMLNLGRTDLDNKGLLRYKREWGCTEYLLKYYLININPQKIRLSKYNYTNLIKKIIFLIPRPLNHLTTNWLYKHFG